MPKKAVISESRRCLLNVRTTEAMRKTLEQAAAASGRPLIHEIEHRLEMALWLEKQEEWEQQVFTTAENQRLGNSLKLATAFALKYFGKNWKESEASRVMVRLVLDEALKQIFDNLPQTETESDLDAETLALMKKSATFISSLALSVASNQPTANSAPEASIRASADQV